MSEQEYEVVKFLWNKGYKGRAISAQNYSLEESALKAYRQHIFGEILIFANQYSDFFRYKWLVSPKNLSENE